MDDLEHDDDTTVRCTGADAIADLRAVLELCAAGRLRCSAKTRRPTAASVAAVSAALLGGDFYPAEPIASYAWPLLVQAGGLAELAGNRLQLTARGRTALTRPAAATIRDLWRRWLRDAVIDEFSRIEAIKGQRTAHALSSATGRRQTVANALESCPVGEWVPVDELFARMRRDGLDPTVARSERGLWKLYLGDAQYGSLGYAGFHDWTLLEGRYTLAVLFEYAATIGLLDVAYREPAGARDDFRDNWGSDELPYLSRYDGLTAIRLTPLGGYAVGVSDRPPPDLRAEKTAPAGARTVKVLANHDIVALGEVSAGQQMLLSAYADQTSDRVWRLSMASLLTAAGHGRRPEELLDHLVQATYQEVPGTVRTLIADAATRAASLTDRGMVRLVECVDPALAALLSSDRTLSRLCQRVGERHLTIDADREAAFRAALIRLGYALSVGLRG